MHLIPTLRAAMRRLRADRSGVAMVEFAFAMPPVLFISLYGMEVGNLALVNMKVSQAALNLADNASRVGLDTGLTTVQLREVDINDALAGARVFGQYWKLGEYGRVTVSSLYNDGKEQRIQWQRCLGKMKGVDWESHYGTASVTAGTDTSAANKGTLRPQGMGPVGSEVNAPANIGVIFVEVNFKYQPLFGLGWIDGKKSRISYTASYMVRDRRDFTQIYNPAPAATRYTCDKYTAE